MIKKISAEQNEINKSYIEAFDEVINYMAPEDKTVQDFTGGYIYHTATNTKLVIAYGTKPNSTNKSTSTIVISEDEVELYFTLLRIKINDLRNSKKKTNRLTSLKDKVIDCTDGKAPNLSTNIIVDPFN